MSKFCHNTQCSVDAWIVALLWKFPQMPSSSANNANLDKHNFDMFYKIYCCAAIHGQIWMIDVPLKWKYNNYVIMHWNKFCYIFLRFWEILSQTQVSFFNFFLTHIVYSLIQASFYIIVHKYILMNFLTRSPREPGGPCTKSMEVSESRMERVNLWFNRSSAWLHACMVHLTALDIQVSLRKLK